MEGHTHTYSVISVGVFGWLVGVRRKIGTMKMAVMIGVVMVAVIVVVVAAMEVDASWAPHNHNHDYRRRGRGGARYYYYNTLLQRAQRHKPDELRK